MSSSLLKIKDTKNRDHLNGCQDTKDVFLSTQESDNFSSRSHNGQVPTGWTDKKQEYFQNLLMVMMVLYH